MEAKEKKQGKSAEYEAVVRAGPHLRPLQQAHAHLVVTGCHRSRALLTKLLTLSCAAGSIAYTRCLLYSVSQPDSFLFNSLIKASSKFRFSLDTILFYRRMLLSRIPPSTYTFTSVIKACADISALPPGKLIHSHVFVSGYDSDSFVQTALVAFYAKSSALRVARKVFDKMPRPSVVAWNSIISGYELNGLANEALVLFKKMRDLGVEPDSATFVCVSSACSQLGSLDFGCWVHDCVVSSGVCVNVVLATSLINMFSRCGDVRRARVVFDSMNEGNVVSWTAMISGYGMHGYGVQAMELFHQMKACGIVPNSVTFVAVLSACAHAGLIDEGRSVFASMKQEYDLVPGVEHHVCMVDMFGRAGLLNEAYQFVKGLSPEELVPAIWTAMLGACKMHKNFDLGVEVAEHLISAEPENPGHYVLLSNMYALAGRMDRVESVRNVMIQRGLKKQVGYSTIDVNNKTYLFSMGDKSHPETNEIYHYLDELMWRCKEAGYFPVPESAMHELEDEEREYALRYHSEKLAVAFGLMRTSCGMTLRIVKNLRICEDCHSAIKFISIVTNREIIIRDKLRFHHFREGSCSCLDYWVGKGIDAGLNQISMFEAKVASGNAEHALSRDVYWLGLRLDFLCMLSMFYTNVGLFSVLPMIVETSLEHRVLKAVWEFLTMQLQFASLFYTFSLGTRAHFYGWTVLHGGTKCQATGCGPGVLWWSCWSIRGTQAFYSVNFHMGDCSFLGPGCMIYYLGLLLWLWWQRSHGFWNFNQYKLRFSLMKLSVEVFRYCEI